MVNLDTQWHVHVGDDAGLERGNREFLGGRQDDTAGGLRKGNGGDRLRQRGAYVEMAALFGIQLDQTALGPHPARLDQTQAE